MMPVYLPLALFTNVQTRSFQAFQRHSPTHSLSHTVVLVLRADVNQVKDFFMSTKLIASQASERLKRTHPCIEGRPCL